jgi:hypothetical protein
LKKGLMTGDKYVISPKFFAFQVDGVCVFAFQVEEINIH